MGHDVGVDTAPRLKYAHIETERRFLLDGVPVACEGVAIQEIRDRYVFGTRLRLRVLEVSGEPTVWKLGQKVRIDLASPLRVAHTTIYLDKSEVGALAALPAAELTKSRRTLVLEGHTWAVDEFRGELTGLVLAEIDLGEDRPMPARLPFATRREVTNDDRYSGGALAETPANAVAELITGGPL
jgi:CYTH domain-containing protein